MSILLLDYNEQYHADHSPYKNKPLTHRIGISLLMNLIKVLRDTEVLLQLRIVLTEVNTKRLDDLITTSTPMKSLIRIDHLQNREDRK